MDKLSINALIAQEPNHAYYLVFSSLYRDVWLGPRRRASVGKKIKRNSAVIIVKRIILIYTKERLADCKGLRENRWTGPYSIIEP